MKVLTGILFLNLLVLSSSAFAASSPSFPGRCYLETEYPIGPVQVNELTSDSGEPQTLFYTYAGVIAKVSFSQFQGPARQTTQLSFVFLDASSTEVTYTSTTFVDLTNIPSGGLLGELTVSKNPTTQMSYNLSCERP